MKDLAGAVFDPLTLKERKHIGRAMTGRHLWSLLRDCDRFFQDGAVPEVKNMVEGFARMKNRLAYEDGLKKFREKFELEVEKTGNDKDASYFEAQAGAIQYFEENTKFGTENFREEYRQRLILDCQDQFKRKSAWDECQKIKAEISSSETLHEVWTNYKDAMKKGMGNQYRLVGVIGELHSRHFKAAILEYQIESAKNASFNEEHFRRLKDQIEMSFCKLKAVNEERHMLETLGCQDDMIPEYEAYLLLQTIAQQYREEFEKYSSMYVQEPHLKGQIEQLKRCYLEIFSKKWEKNGPNIDAFRIILMRLLEEEYQDCLLQNERNKEVLEQRIEKCLITIRLNYQEKMSQLVEKFYCDPSNLRKAHDSIVYKLTGDLAKAVGELETSEKQKVIARAQEYFSSEFANFVKRNEENRNEKPPIDWDTLKNKLIFASNVATIADIAIRQFTSLLHMAESAYGTIQPLLSAQILPAAEALATAVPYMGSGGGVAVVAYCVYRHYKTQKSSKN